jgi:hypothetical protein
LTHTHHCIASSCSCKPHQHRRCHRRGEGKCQVLWPPYLQLTLSNHTLQLSTTLPHPPTSDLPLTNREASRFISCAEFVTQLELSSLWDGFRWSSPLGRLCGLQDDPNKGVAGRIEGGRWVGQRCAPLRSAGCGGIGCTSSSFYPLVYLGRAGSIWDDDVCGGGGGRARAGISLCNQAGGRGLKRELLR